MTPEQTPSINLTRTEAILQQDIQLLNNRREHILQQQSDNPRTTKLLNALTNGIESIDAKLGTIQAVAGYRDAITLMETTDDSNDTASKNFIAMRKEQLARFEAYLDADSVLQKRLRREASTRPNGHDPKKGIDIFTAQMPAQTVTCMEVDHQNLPTDDDKEAESERKAASFKSLETVLFESRHRYSHLLGRDKKQARKRIATICNSLAEIDRLFPELTLTALNASNGHTTIPAGKAASRMYPGVNFDTFRQALLKLRASNLLQASEAPHSLPIREVPLSPTHLAAIRFMEETDTIAIDPFSAAFVRSFLHDALRKLGELSNTQTATALPIGPIR